MYRYVCVFLFANVHRYVCSLVCCLHRYVSDQCLIFEHKHEHEHGHDHGHEHEFIHEHEFGFAITSVDLMFIYMFMLILKFVSVAILPHQQQILHIATAAAMSPGRQLLQLLKTKKKKGKKKQRALVLSQLLQASEDIASLKAQTAKKKEEFNTLQAQLAALCPEQADSEDSEPDEFGTYVNWSRCDVGGIKASMVPAVQSVYLRKACRCGARIKVWCGYDGFMWKMYSGDRQWTRVGKRAPGTRCLLEQVTLDKSLDSETSFASTD